MPRPVGDNLIRRSRDSCTRQAARRAGVLGFLATNRNGTPHINTRVAVRQLHTLVERD